MKKFTYLGVVLLASVLALAGCRRGRETSSSTEPTSSQTTSSSTSGSTTSGSSSSSSSSVPVQPEVKSVSVSPKTLSLAVNETSTLKATVTVQGDADKSVKWESSDPSVASVSSSGLVKGLKIGNATITCTSTFDTSKSATCSVSVANKGFLPELIDEGYTYYETWAKAESVVKSFIGSGSYSISAPYDVSKGAYVLTSPSTSTDIGYASVVVDGDQTIDYIDKLCLEDYHVWEELFWGIFPMTYAIDPTKTFEVDPSEYYDSNYEIAGMQLTFYKTSDLFYDETLTSNTDWTNAEKAEFAKVEGIEEIPFVKLGAHYEVAAYEYEVEGVYDVVFIEDYSLAWNALDNYGTTLLGAGYSYDAINDMYTKPVDGSSYLSQYVAISWGSSGNYIEVGTTVSTFNSFPSDLVNEFTSMVLGSEYTVPAPIGANATSFTYSETEYEEFGGLTAVVDGYSYSYDEFVAYKNLLIADGYSVNYLPEDDENYGQIEATKGRIALYAYYENDYDYETEIYSDESGTLYIAIYQGSGFENPGLYFSEKTANVGLNSTYQIMYTLYEIEGTVSFESADSGIASVSSTGLVTGLSEGTTTVTGRVEYNNVTYADTVVITVSSVQYFTKVESALGDYSGTYLLVYEKGGYAFNGATTTLDAAFNSFQVVIKDNQILASDDLIDAAVTIASNGSNTYSICAGESYIGNKSGSNKLQTSQSAADFKNKISVSAGVASIEAEDGTSLKFNTGNDQLRFRFYKSTAGGTADIALYRLV